eukprot:gene5226-3741_t
MLLSINLFALPVLSGVAAVVLANFAFFLSRGVAAYVWLCYLAVVAAVCMIICRCSALPYRHLPVADYTDRGILMALAILLAGRELVAWRGAVTGLLALTLVVGHLRHNVQYWGTLHQRAKLELAFKSAAALVATLLQVIYYSTLRSSAGGVLPPEDQHVRLAALVASLGTLSEAVQVAGALLLLTGGLRACEWLQRRWFPASESLYQSALDPMVPSFHLLPSLVSHTAVVVLGVLTMPSPPSVSLNLIVFAGGCALSYTFVLWREYRRILDPIPVITVSEDVQCCICLETISTGARARELACGHSFHGACLANWMLLRGECPLCRAPIVVPEDDRRGRAPRWMPAPLPRRARGNPSPPQRVPPPPPPPPASLPRYIIPSRPAPPPPSMLHSRAAPQQRGRRRRPVSRSSSSLSDSSAALDTPGPPGATFTAHPLPAPAHLGAHPAPATSHSLFEELPPGGAPTAVPRPEVPNRVRARKRRPAASASADGEAPPSKQRRSE